MTPQQLERLELIADSEESDRLPWPECEALQAALAERAELLAACEEFLGSPGGSAREKRALVAMREAVAKARGCAS